MVGFLVTTDDSLSQANERNVKGAEMGHGKVFKCLKDPLEMITPPSSPAKKNHCGGGFRDDLLKKRPVVPRCTLLLRPFARGSISRVVGLKRARRAPWGSPMADATSRDQCHFLLQGVAKKSKKTLI